MSDLLSELVTRERAIQEFEWTVYTRTFFLSYCNCATSEPRGVNWRRLFARLRRKLSKL